MAWKACNNNKDITLTDLRAWCFDSTHKPAVKAQWLGAAQHIKQQTELHHESQRIQHQANKAAIIHQNQMIKRKHTANRRLQQRLAARNGTTSVVVAQPQYIPVPTYNTTPNTTQTLTSTSFLAKARQHAALEEVNAIQQQSQQARKKSLKQTQLKKNKAQTNLQKRLALRQRAKQEQALKKCKSFQHVSNTAQDQIVDAMTFQTMKEDTVLCEQGSVADNMFLLMSGHCSVQVDGVHVANLYELDVFGENALFSTTSNSTRNRPMLRSATVIAREDVDVLVLSRAALKTLLHSKVLDRQTMKALKKVAEGRRQQNALMKEAMHVDALKECSVFASLTKAKRETIVKAMALQVFEKDQVLCTQGEAADAMYLVMSGKCAVVVGGQTVGTLEKLEVFGESALLGGARNATVRAVTARVEVLVLLQKDLIMLDQACVAGIETLAKKRKKSNSRREEEQKIIIVEHEKKEHE